MALSLGLLAVVPQLFWSVHVRVAALPFPPVSQGEQSHASVQGPADEPDPVDPLLPQMPSGHGPVELVSPLLGPHVAAPSAPSSAPAKRRIRNIRCSMTPPGSAARAVRQRA